jgi:hypothetical protein
MGEHELAFWGCDRPWPAHLGAHHAAVIIFVLLLVLVTLLMEHLQALRSCKIGAQLQWL